MATRVVVGTVRPYVLPVQRRVTRVLARARGRERSARTTGSRFDSTEDRRGSEVEMSNLALARALEAIIPEDVPDTALLADAAAALRSADDADWWKQQAQSTQTALDNARRMATNMELARDEAMRKVHKYRDKLTELGVNLSDL